MRKVLYILGQLNDEDVIWMSAHGQVKHLDSGQILIQQNSMPTHMFIVLSGRLQVSITSVGDIAQLEAGDVVGEMSFVDSSPASATVTGQEASTVLSLDRRLIDMRLQENQGFAARLYKALAIYLSDRLRKTNQQQGITTADRDVDELDDLVLDSVSMAGTRFGLLLELTQRKPTHST